jgi:hypothetical protein
LAVAVAADLGGVVAFAEGGEHGLQLGAVRRTPRGAVEVAQGGQEGRAVLEERFPCAWRRGEQLADLLLPLLAGSRSRRAAPARSSSLLVARFEAALVSSRAMRSAVAWKFSRRGARR